MAPAPAGQTPGAVLMRPDTRWAWGESDAQISCGIDGANTLSCSQGAPYSTLGMALISRPRFGVAPCHARTSRKTPAPAGAPTRVDSRIHSGSSAGEGGAPTRACVPGIWRIGPFSQVRSDVRKLIATMGGVRS
jgi:hypothetical protein